MQQSPDWEIHIAVHVCGTDSSVLPNEKRMIDQNIHTPHWHVGKYNLSCKSTTIIHLNISQCSHNQLRLKCHLHHKSNTLTLPSCSVSFATLKFLPFELPHKNTAPLSLSLSLSRPLQENVNSYKSDASFSSMRHLEALAEAAEFDWLSNCNVGTWLEARVTQPKTENSPKIYVT